MPSTNPIRWNTVLQERKQAEAIIPGHYYERIPPFVTPNLDGLEIFRLLAINFKGRPTWWLAGSVIQYQGLSSDSFPMVLKRQTVQLNNWTIFIAERFDEPFFLAFEPAYWHIEMDLTIDEYSPIPGTGGGGGSFSQAITVEKNAIVNPSFEIWNATGTGDYVPTGTQRITLAPGWEIRTWTGGGADFGTVRLSRESPSDDTLPFNTYLHWEQLTPYDTSGNLNLANQINERAVAPGDAIVFSGFARTSSPSGLSVRVIMEGGGHPWTNIGSINVNSVWAPFSISYLLPSSLPSNLYGLLVEFLMPSNSTFDLDVAALQLEVSTSATGLELYFA